MWHWGHAFIGRREDKSPPDCQRLRKRTVTGGSGKTSRAARVAGSRPSLVFRLGMKDTRRGRFSRRETDAVKLFPRLLVMAALAGGGAAGAWAASARWWPLELPGRETQALPGLRVDGQPVGPAGVRALVDAQAATLGQRRVRLVVREGDVLRPVFEASLAELGVTVDADTVTVRALRVGRTDDLLTRARLADRARRGDVDVPLEPTVDP